MCILIFSVHSIFSIPGLFAITCYCQKSLMSTELQKQVSALRDRSLNSESLNKGKLSLFLSSKEAAGVDVEDIYEVACQSIDILIQYDSRFEFYKENLLHPSSTRLQRELKTSSENSEINNNIISLLRLLTAYIEQVACHQIIEYLIRRYRVNELNVEELLLCFLPIHDSKV